MRKVNYALEETVGLVCVPDLPYSAAFASSPTGIRAEFGEGYAVHATEAIHNFALDIIFMLDPAMSLPVGSNRPPRYSWKNGSATANSEIQFFGCRKSCGSSG